MNTSESESLSRQPIVGVSQWARSLQNEIDGAAPFPSNVLISGPTGTGKELIAQELHRRSPRAHNPFIAVNCAAIAPSLFESQLFGHLKGSFTSADADAMGYFRAAEGGTLFLDEIGELELPLQAKLLRVLQEGTVTPVGGHEAVKIDVRIVAATNRDLLVEAAAGRFRQDLFYRLSVAVIRTISLSERPEDLYLISQFLISKLCHDSRMQFKPMSPAAEARLIGHDWPGNVRELQNVLERALMRAEGPMIEPGDIVFDKQPENQANGETANATEANNSSDLNFIVRDTVQSMDGWPTLEQFERHILQMTLERTGYNQTEAARILDISRSSLYRRVKEYQLETANIQPLSRLNAQERNMLTADCH